MEGLRGLPKVDAVANALGESLAWVYRVEAARRSIDWARASVREGRLLSWEDLVERARGEADRLARRSLRSAINATGIVLHTGLGRARWAKDAAEAAADASANHTLLEIDLETGGRGDRQKHIQEHLRVLVGCEDALVVNNCAAAMVLILATLARGRDVLLSRGQMVEIGGSFRMPEVIEASGCRLIEVGCTNKTRVADYERALHAGVSAILRCHPSNYAIIGFTEEPDPRELRGLADQYGVLLVDDMGSGCLADLSRFELPRVETMRDVACWAHVAAASGDKLLGGPQAGLIFGMKAYIDAIRRHPLARALRPDKSTLAALEATLRLYREGRELEIPTLKYLSRTRQDLRRLAGRLARKIGARARIVPSTSEVGGGSLPGVSLSGWAVQVVAEDPQILARSLRFGEPPILARVQDGKVLLDPRTLEEDELGIVAARVRDAVAREGAHG